MAAEQPMRIFCRANAGLNVACRGDKVLLVTADPSDSSQHWIKDSRTVGNLTDSQGARAFALVNVTTGQALASHGYDWEALELVPYSGHVTVELPMLWSLGEPQTEDGFRQIRAVREISLTFDAYGGTPIKEGAVVGTYTPQNYDHCIWKIVPIHE